MVPRGRPAPPGTQAWVRVTAVTTSSHGRLGTLSEGSWHQPAFLGDSGQCPRTHGVDQLSQATMERARDVVVSNSCPGRLVLGPRNPGSTTLQGDSASDPSARGVDQLSRATRNCTQGLAWSSRYPRQLRHVSERPRCRPALPGDSGTCAECPWCRSALLGDPEPGRRACGVDQLSPASRSCVRGTQCLPLFLGDSGSCPKARVSNSCPWGLALVSKVPRGLPAVPGHLGLGLSARGVDQLSGRFRPG